MIETSLVPDLEAYIASFNRSDWEKIESEILDEKTQVYVDGKLVAEEREKRKPGYLLDFDRKRQVKIVATPQSFGIESGARGGEASIRVMLSVQDGSSSMASSTPPPPIQVDVIYTYNVRSRKQVRHEILLRNPRITV
jgi:hypothetical protein